MNQGNNLIRNNAAIEIWCKSMLGSFCLLDLFTVAGIERVEFFLCQGRLRLQSVCITFCEVKAQTKSTVL